MASRRQQEAVHPSGPSVAESTAWSGVSRAAPPHFAAAPIFALGTPPPEPIDHELTVIVPALNEEARLPATLDGLRDYLDDWGVDYRIVVVDDGSTDGTATQTAGRGFRFSTLRQKPMGKGAAVRNGILRSTGRILAFTDADLPYHLDALRTAYSAIAEGECEVVFGARDLDESAMLARRRPLRTIATAAFRAIVRLLVSREVTDTQCGLKAFCRRAGLEIFSRTTIDAFAFDAEVVFLTHRLALPFKRIPVTLVNEYGSTISLTRHALPMLFDVLRLRLRAWQGAYDRQAAGQDVAERTSATHPGAAA